jgi:hypothetical protein
MNCGAHVRREWRWSLAAVAAIGVGAVCAEPYARFATPYYTVVARLIAEWHPWKIDEVVVADEPRSHGAVLRMTGEVYRHRVDPWPAARVVTRVQVGEAVATPILFWTLMLMWPATTIRQRVRSLAMGVPVFLGLEAIGTGCQLVHSMAEASAILAGSDDPLTPWEHWSRFLEGGGGCALALAAALLTVSVATPPPAGGKHE